MIVHRLNLNGGNPYMWISEAQRLYVARDTGYAAEIKALTGVSACEELRDHLIAARERLARDARLEIRHRVLAAGEHYASTRCRCQR